MWTEYAETLWLHWQTKLKPKNYKHWRRRDANERIGIIFNKVMPEKFPILRKFLTPVKGVH
jgi:hypothetical protein